MKLVLEAETLGELHEQVIAASSELMAQASNEEDPAEEEEAPKKKKAPAKKEKAPAKKKAAAKKKKASEPEDDDEDEETDLGMDDEDEDEGSVSIEDIRRVGGAIIKGDAEGGKATVSGILKEIGGTVKLPSIDEDKYQAIYDALIEAQDEL